jgi:hypothetical protein
VIDVLTIAALLFGIAGVLLDIVILVRQHAVEERLTRDELHEALENHHDGLFERLIEHLVEPPQFCEPAQPVEVDPEPGQIYVDEDYSPISLRTPAEIKAWREEIDR